MKWKLESFWQNLRSIPSFIVRLIEYSTLLWNDRDWDYIFLLHFMKYKIERMRKHMLKHNILENSELYAEEMQETIDTIDRILENNYSEDEWAALDEKWGKLVMLEAPCEESPGAHYIEFTREKCITEEDKEQERELTRALHEKQIKEENKDYELLFKQLHERIRKWWD